MSSSEEFVIRIIKPRNVFENAETARFSLKAQRVVLKGEPLDGIFIKCISDVFAL